jgi:uncharacterized protein (DUF697 family)
LQRRNRADEAEGRSEEMDREARCDVLISDHVVYSMAAALIPIPIVDVGAVAAVQLDLIQGLAECYDVKYDRERGKAIISSLVGASLPKLGASAFKIVPGLGTLIGGAAQVVLSGASTYAIGNVFQSHFDREGKLEDLDTEDVASLYRQYFEKGKEVAESLRSFLEPKEQGSVEGVARTLDRLERLRATGAITAEEFEILKSAAVDEVSSPTDG